MPRDSREPHFFATDLESFRHIKSLDAYIALFAPATPHHVAIGEKSAYYLYSTCALKEILRFNNRAKVIALLRDPIELVYSYYYKVRWTLDEDQADFQTAWLLQSERQAGRRVPKGCRYPFKLQYHAVAALESQVQRLFELLPADQIKVVLFDDLVLSPRRVYDDVLTFLGVSSDNRCHFPPVNQNRTYRYAFFHRLMISPPKLWTAAGAFVNGSLHLKRDGVFGLYRGLLSRWNYTSQPRPPLSSDFRRELQRVFAPEMKLIEILTNGKR